MTCTRCQARYTALYRERAHLLALLATAYPAVIATSDPNTPDWPVLTVTTPAGQMCWHIDAADAHLFAHVPTADPPAWDGHTTDQKYARLRALTEARAAHA